MSLPKRVTVELTNRCNRACTGCPRHQMRYPQGDMNENLWKQTLEQLPERSVVVPFFRGEPTIHPQFHHLLRNLQRFESVQLATNGDYLTKENQKAILENVTFLSVSLHEFLYPNQTKLLGFLYDCVGAGIETQISILASQIDEAKRGQWITEWRRHVSRIRIYEDHSQNGFGSLPQKRAAPTPCTKPFEEMVVYWDGKVGLCNHDWNNQTYLGDLNTESISKVWNGSKYNAVRAFHNMNLRRQIESCKACDFQSNKLSGELIQCQ